MSKITIAMPLNEKIQYDLVKAMNGFNLLDSGSEIHFVHIYEFDNYPYLSSRYPDDAQQNEITKHLTEKIQNLFNELPVNNIKVHIEYHENSKEGMIRYLTRHKIDTVLTFTREKHGILNFFHSSFTDYLIKHAPCNVFVLRHKEE